MKEQFEKYKNIIKDLRDNHIYLSDLLIWDEIDSQLEEELTDNQLEILYNTVERAYMKAEEVDLYDLVKYCINNLDKLYDMNIWDILGNC